MQITKTKMSEGVWRGIITGTGEEEPAVAVSHQDRLVEGVLLTHNQSADHWTISIPIPPAAISDGIQTLLIFDSSVGEKISHITILAGDVLTDDIRAEMDLLRAELDMLKHAFRRHCRETT